MNKKNTKFDPLSFLNQRNKRIPAYSYKLNTEANKFGMDVSFPQEMIVNESRMSMVIPFADGNSRDGVGDVLEVAGIKLDRHRKNPIVLFDHGKKVTLPIALAEDPDTKAYTVQIDAIAKTACAESFFYQGNGIQGLQRHSAEVDHAVFCEQLFDLVVKRYIRAGSIGYQVIKASRIPPDYMTGSPEGLHLLSVLMLELSLVVLPANADTVVKIFSMPSVCGKKLSPYLVKSLAPYAPPRKAVMGPTGTKGNFPSNWQQHTRNQLNDVADAVEAVHGVPDGAARTRAMGNRIVNTGSSGDPDDDQAYREYWEQQARLPADQRNPEGEEKAIPSFGEDYHRRVRQLADQDLEAFQNTPGDSLEERRERYNAAQGFAPEENAERIQQEANRRVRMASGEYDEEENKKALDTAKLRELRDQDREREHNFPNEEALNAVEGFAPSDTRGRRMPQARIRVRASQGINQGEINTKGEFDDKKGENNDLPENSPIPSEPIDDWTDFNDSIVGNIVNDDKGIKSVIDEEKLAVEPEESEIIDEEGQNNLNRAIHGARRLVAQERDGGISRARRPSNRPKQTLNKKSIKSVDKDGPGPNDPPATPRQSVDARLGTGVIGTVRRVLGGHEGREETAREYEEAASVAANVGQQAIASDTRRRANNTRHRGEFDRFPSQNQMRKEDEKKGTDNKGIKSADDPGPNDPPASPRQSVNSRLGTGIVAGVRRVLGGHVQREEVARQSEQHASHQANSGNMDAARRAINRAENWRQNDSPHQPSPEVSQRNQSKKGTEEKKLNIQTKSDPSKGNAARGDDIIGIANSEVGIVDNRNRRVSVRANTSSGPINTTTDSEQEAFDAVEGGIREATNQKKIKKLYNIRRKYLGKADGTNHPQTWQEHRVGVVRNFANRASSPEARSAYAEHANSIEENQTSGAPLADEVYETQFQEYNQRNRTPNPAPPTPNKNIKALRSKYSSGQSVLTAPREQRPLEVDGNKISRRLANEINSHPLKALKDPKDNAQEAVKNEDEALRLDRVANRSGGLIAGEASAQADKHDQARLQNEKRAKYSKGIKSEEPWQDRAAHALETGAGYDRRIYGREMADGREPYFDAARMDEVQARKLRKYGTTGNLGTDVHLEDLYGNIPEIKSHEGESNDLPPLDPIQPPQRQRDPKEVKREIRENLSKQPVPERTNIQADGESYDYGEEFDRDMHNTAQGFGHEPRQQDRYENQQQNIRSWGDPYKAPKKALKPEPDHQTWQEYAAQYQRDLGNGDLADQLLQTGTYGYKEQDDAAKFLFNEYQRQKQNKGIKTQKDETWQNRASHHLEQSSQRLASASNSDSSLPADQRMEHGIGEQAARIQQRADKLRKEGTTGDLGLDISLQNSFSR